MYSLCWHQRALGGVADMRSKSTVPNVLKCANSMVHHLMNLHNFQIGSIQKQIRRSTYVNVSTHCKFRSSLAKQVLVTLRSGSGFQLVLISNIPIFPDILASVCENEMLNWWKSAWTWLVSGSNVKMRACNSITRPLKSGCGSVVNHVLSPKVLLQSFDTPHKPGNMACSLPRVKN